ncbi:MAG: RDD family protein [Alphaproteobacteria bacterium]
MSNLPELRLGPAPGRAEGPLLFAGFWLRVLAWLVDVLLLSLLGSIIGIASGLALLPLAGLAGLVISWLYFALLESSRHEATLGKMLIEVKVTDLEGRRVSFARASGRYFAKYVSLALLGAGFFMVAFTGRKQGLHDMLSGCLVIRAPRMAAAGAGS